MKEEQCNNCARKDTGRCKHQIRFNGLGCADYLSPNAAKRNTMSFVGSDSKPVETEDLSLKSLGKWFDSLSKMEKKIMLYMLFAFGVAIYIVVAYIIDFVK